MDLMNEAKNILMIRYPRFASLLAATPIEYHRHLKYHTGATDGKKILIDPDYFVSLELEGRLFLLAHELMHMQFLHMYRLKKDGKKKDLDVWNEATDAIINANLVRDGFQIEEDYFTYPDALSYTAEQLYEKLLNEDGDYTKSTWRDDHSLWKEAFEKMETGEDQVQKPDTKIDEKQEFRENREERIAKAKKDLKQKKEQVLKEWKKNKIQNELGTIGEENNAIDWLLLLRREVNKDEIIWSNRRSIAENNYAYRLEEDELEEEAETEVLIDVSGSVSLNLVKSFLRIIKPILHHSKLKVGCFNEKYYKMVEIKSNDDIDHFVIPEESHKYAWTEDWDLAVRSFTRKKEINKIIFTDGIPGPGNMPKEDLKNENVIWIVYGNPNFKPCCGKVIQVTESELLGMILSEEKGKIR